MTPKMEMRLANTHLGKVCLHIICIKRTHNVRRHWDGVVRELDIEITKGGHVKNKQGKIVKEADEYFEGTVTPDMDGKMKDVVESIDDVDHLDLKKIADEVDTLIIKKASGGLAYALGE